MSVTGVAVLGATGSIGRSAAQVLERFPERFRVTGLVARSNTAELVRQAEQFRAGITITTDPETFRELRGAHCGVQGGQRGGAGICSPLHHRRS